MGNNQSLQHLSNHTEKIVMLVRSIQKNLREYIFEKSKKYGLTGPQMLLIFNLYKNSGINLIDLSKMMELSESTVSGILDRLVAQNIVIREIPEDNRRTIRLSLSQNFYMDYFGIIIK